MSRGRRPREAPARKPPSPRITLSEEDGVRYLHFGSEWVQGAMRIGRPWAIELEYQQQMMAPLLFLPAPRHVLQLGVGAAALTRFCWRHLGAAITAVEISEEVLAAARRWFALPDEDERLSIVVDDARHVVSNRRVQRVDWLQVDLYDRAARGPVLDDAAFYAACRRLLVSPGIACFNLFGRGFDGSFSRIASAFDDRVLVLPEADGGNRVALAFAGPPLRVGWTTLYGHARQIETQFGLPARKWVSGLREQGAAEALEI